MAAIEQQSLFTWKDVEARSNLDRLTLVRDHLPDERIVQYLEAMRGKGRDDYRRRPMWNAVLAGVVFPHPSMESLIRERSRNRSLLQARGFEILPVQRKPVAELVRDGHGGRPQVLWSKPGDVSPGEYGRIVRIKLTEQDRRIFTPTPYGSPSWQRGYNRRSALERINNRIDHSFGFERHFIRGKTKMQVRVGLALAVMMAMALGHVKAGRTEQMRSLVQPIPATG